MNDDPRLRWYQGIWSFIRDQAKAATDADFFETAEAMHVSLIAASMEHLIACAEYPEDLERVVQIIRSAEALTLARSRFFKPTRH